MATISLVCEYIRIFFGTDCITIRTDELEELEVVLCGRNIAINPVRNPKITNIRVTSNISNARRLLNSRTLV